MNLFFRILSTLSKKDELRIIHAHRNLKSTSNISVGKIAIARDFAIVLQERLSVGIESFRWLADLILWRDLNQMEHLYL